MRRSAGSDLRALEVVRAGGRRPGGAGEVTPNAGAVASGCIVTRDRADLATKALKSRGVSHGRPLALVLLLPIPRGGNHHGHRHCPRD